MEIMSPARHPFEKCALYIFGHMTETMSGNKYILTFQDDLSKFVVAIPFPQQDAETVAKECVKYRVKICCTCTNVNRPRFKLPK
jgi:hypothetical protein